MLVAHPDPLPDSRAVPLPFSRSHIERLGVRLVAGPEPDDSDIEELHRLLEAYDGVLTATLTRVRDAIGVAPTSRVKNSGTILEKLHRQGGSWLKSMHDIAGMRIVSAGDRNAQDTIVSELIQLFGGEPRAPRIIDRREKPSHGYRAVHVIVFPDEVQVEIQVRTHWQHEWADMFEKLADRVGRDIRYGAPPEQSLPQADRVTYTARIAVVGQALAVADLISAVENAEAANPGAPQLEGFRRGVFTSLTGLRQSIELLGADGPLLSDS
jgi:ppGpp synthetase/RelA/SpoT-type nucleotidyltranferase